MRRRRLKKLIKRLRELQQQNLTRDDLRMSVENRSEESNRGV
jgi:hypothetical protein